MRSRPLHSLRKPRTWRLSGGLYVIGAYLAFAVLVTAVAVGLRGALPWAHPTPSWPLSPLAAVGWSVILCAGIALLVIAFSRIASRRFDWAQRLADGLRPTASSFSAPEIVAVALASSIAEELLFRAVLVPWLGVIPAAIAFGLAHQMRGPSRFVWIAFSCVVGMGLGAVYASTGSLIGPIFAHAAINAVNLAWLKSGRPSGSLEALPRAQLLSRA